MLSWILAFFVLALVAAVLGFTGLAGFIATAAKVMFFVFLALLIFSGIVGTIGGSNHGRE